MSWTDVLIVTMLAGGQVPGALAAEQQTTPSTPTAKASTPATVTPPLLTAQGAITALDAKATPPSLTVSGADGKVWTFQLDPQTTTVWKSGEPVKLDRVLSADAASPLKIGDQVSVRYVLRDGKDVAKSIKVVQAPASGAASSTPATKTH